MLKKLYLPFLQPSGNWVGNASSVDGPQSTVQLESEFLEEGFRDGSNDEHDEAPGRKDIDNVGLSSYGARKTGSNFPGCCS